jgi:hypothetical protein
VNKYEVFQVRARVAEEIGRKVMGPIFCNKLIYFFVQMTKEESLQLV